MRTPTRVVFAVMCAVVLGTVLVGCAGETEKEGAMELMIRSTAFDHGGAIPRRYTCEGDDVSPPLAWSELPDGAKSLVLIVDDPDAPDPAKPRMTWVHWVLYDIPATAAGMS